MKSAYKFIREAWKKPYNLNDWTKRLIEFRQGDAAVKVDKPLRIDRAHALGYKAKKGYVVLRIRLLRGGRTRGGVVRGRRSKRRTIRKTLMMNYKGVAEQRAERKFPNLVALNSYWIAQDGLYAWYEVIMVDPNLPEIKNDSQMRWILKRKKRATRGLTSTHRKSRGL